MEQTNTKINLFETKNNNPSSSFCISYYDHSYTLYNPSSTVWN